MTDTSKTELNSGWNCAEKNGGGRETGGRKRKEG